MATPIKRIEKEYLLKVLYDEQIPVVYLKNRTKNSFTLEKPANAQIFLKTDRPVTGFKVREKIDLMFDYRGQVISFSLEIGSIKGEHIAADTPEFLYKNLDRSYSRVQTPQDMQVQFTFSGDRYSLNYPRISDYENVEEGDLVKKLDPKNLNGLIAQMAAWIKGYASGYKLVIFKDVKPESIEERVIAEMGKILYLPSTRSSFPLNDPYPKKRLVTEDMFKRYLETTGVGIPYLAAACERFVKNKIALGVFSDAWVPILFQEYVIGYIHIWINKEQMPPFDHSVIDTLYQFAKILAFSLKTNGFFETGKLKNDPFEGNVIDMSASGLLFAYPHSSLAATLLPDSELSVQIITPQRTAATNARIVRRYKDNVQGYFGCRFLDMEPENVRFLFEYIYGKPFTDGDAIFLAGQV